MYHVLKTVHLSSVKKTRYNETLGVNCMKIYIIIINYWPIIGLSVYHALKTVHLSSVIDAQAMHIRSLKLNMQKTVLLMSK